jgi:hypothetical protein
MRRGVSLALLLISDHLLVLSGTARPPVPFPGQADLPGDGHLGDGDDVSPISEPPPASYPDIPVAFRAPEREAVLPNNATAIWRRMQSYTIEDYINPTYSSATYLRFTPDNDDPLEGYYKDQLEGVYAGVPVVSVEIVVDLPNAIWQVNGAYLKIVSADVEREGAKKGECASKAKGSDVVNSPWDTSEGAPTLPTIGENTNTLSIDSDFAPTLNFRKGGLFKVCYSKLGTFDTGPADPLNIQVEVAGIYTDCEGENCLGLQVNYCYALKLRSSGSTSCVLDYSDASGSGTGYYGDIGKASWSSEFVIAEGDMDSSGHVRKVTSKPCTTEPNVRICPAGEGCSGSARFFSPDSVPAQSQLHLTMPPTVPTLEKDSYVSFTVAVCYCPGDDSGGTSGSCNENGDFVQQVGIIHYFAAMGCHIDDTECLNDVSGIMPQYEFKLKIMCPTDACPQSEHPRIKLAARTDSNDLPWYAGNTCESAPESTLLVTPANCHAPNNCTLKGGDRQDYKQFGSIEEPFKFVNGVSNYEVRNFHESYEFDICFCLGRDIDGNDEWCDNPAAIWMKVGAFRFAPLRLVSAATDTSDKPALEYVNYPGTVAFHRADADRDVLGLQDGGVIKILMDTARVKGDKECGEANYDNALVEGLTATTAGSDFRAKASEEHKKLVFNNGNPARTLGVKDPGIIAICYCAITSDAICAEERYWKLVTHLTVKGPNPSQTWTFSTNVVFRFDYSGWGLSPGDTLRIIETDAKCTDNEGNPNQADTSIFYNCPDDPQQVSNVPGEEWNFPTELLTSRTVRCNRMGVCDMVYIESVVVKSSSMTELRFTGDPMLKTDDYITIGNPDDPKWSVQCESDCTEEQAAEVQGVYQYADGATNDKTLKDTYILGHKITKVEDGTNRKYTIPVGWENAPKFKTTAPGAEWTRRNLASTREEIRGIKEKSNLKVCWSFGGNGKYVAEVGRLNLRDPTQMTNPRINLSTKAQTDKTNEVKAPVIISFQTTTSAAGAKYNEADGSMQLKLVFTDTRYFDGLFTDGTELTTDDTEDEVNEATQSVCGRLFLETWSDDMTNGFPMPKGCYYRVIDQTQGRVPEIGVVFEKKNGLRQGYNYQIVMMGIAKHLLRQNDPLAENPYLEIYSMDDVDLNPYGAVELGKAKLSHGIGVTPLPTDPQFGPRGFTLQGGYDGVVELDADTPLQFELRGGDGTSTGRITPGAYLRIFLYPLTQWTTGISCDARCVQSEENPFRCGTIESCTGAALVEGFQNNYIMMQLPPDMEHLFAERKHKINVGGLTLPSGAVFPTRLAAELTTKDDTKPHYTTSVGDLIWKGPGKGRILARLVNTVGDGNEMPFRGDKANVLYIQLMFAGLLKAHDAGSAYFNIMLPSKYTIIDVGAAPSDLYVFGDDIPQGRGTLDPSGWTINPNRKYELTYTFAENFVIFSGSSLYVKITVDNPAEALKDVEAGNIWTVQMHGRGVHKDMLHAEPSTFIGVADGYASNAAVLGKLLNQVIQPTNFIPSTLKVPQTQFLRIFFRSEQKVEGGGGIEVFAPPVWHFGAECDARDLEDLVYATGPFESTYRLPEIVKCIGKTTPEYPTVRHRAIVRVTGRINGNQLFGFQLLVVNPRVEEQEELETHMAHPEQGSHMTQFSWRLTTLNVDDMAVDGSFMAVPMFPGATTDGHHSQMGEAGVYREQFTPDSLAFDIADMMPYKLSGKPTLVSATFSLPPEMKRSVKGSMRITAPPGFVWENIGQLATPTGTKGIKHVSRRLLAGDSVDGNKLHFAERTYYPDTKYGFELSARIPDLTDTGSSNGFFVEVGYDKPNIAGREIAGYSPAKQVRSLLNPKVRYTYNVEGKENNMIFDIELTTPIPPQGALRILVPKGFRFSSLCRPVMLLAYSENYLPDGFSCTYEEAVEKLEQSKITIKPGPLGMSVKLYVFALVGQNPAETALLQPDDTPCGFTVCWPFMSLSDSTTPDSYLDSPTTAIGFGINRKMIQARLPLISDSVRTGTGRNDRPDQPNQLIFAFSLNADVLEEHTLTLRGPYGFGFNEDCTKDIVTREDEVFGEGNKWPPEYDPWENDAKILRCAGSGTDAHILITPGLKAEKKYAFRIGIAHNPPRTPEDNNQWVVDYGGETSEPFDGFILWTFTQYSLIPVSRARSQKGVDVDSVGNAVKLIFKPHNRIDASVNGAVYRMTLPEGFSIVHVNFECPLVYESLPYEVDGVVLAGELFTSFDLNCKVDPDHKNIATSRLAEDMMIFNDRQYQMTFEVYNPTSTTVETEALGGLTEPMWMLETFGFKEPHELHARDAISIPSYDITPVLATWTYVNVNSKTGKPQVNGLTKVEGLQLIMEFPDSLLSGDEIHIHAPPGFTLESEYGMCNEGYGIGNSLNINALANSPCKCSGGSMVIMVFEPSPVAKFFEVRYQVSTVNPPENVPDMENYWRVEHIAASGLEGSSHVFKGWVIIPQLESVMVSLVGQFTQALSEGASIEFSFRAVSKADTFHVEAAEPIGFNDEFGFDFTASRTRDPNQEVYFAEGTEAEVIFINEGIKRGAVVSIILDRVTLAMTGGPTVFHLATYEGGMNAGIKKDEARDFREGFRLPGSIQVSRVKLESTYSLDPEKYPIQSMWNVRLGETAQAEFRFYTSITIPAGQTFHLNGDIYNVLARDLRLMDMSSMKAVPTTLWRLVGNDVRLLLGEDLRPNVMYTLRVMVIAPMDVSRGNGYFLLEAIDDQPYPIATNDQLTPGFDLVVEMDFKVSVERSPPSTFIPLRLHIDPKGSRPTELQVYAPPTFNFTADCLISGPKEVLSCQPKKAIEGRETALIVLTEDGLIEPPENLRIKVKTPDGTPAEKGWLVEGIFTVSDTQVGWGEHRDGIRVYQMRDTSVVYAGATGIFSEFAVRFYNVLLLEAGGMLEVRHPTMFTFFCETLRQVSLPGEVACMTYRDTFRLAFNHSVAPGDYSFSIEADIPVDIPDETEFSVLLYDRHGDVQDAAMNIFGPNVTDKLIIMVPTDQQGFKWQPPTIEAGSVTVVTFLLSFEQDVPPDPAEPPVIGNILFTLPKGFMHDIRVPNDFMYDSDWAPFAEIGGGGPKIHYKQLDRVRLTVDNGQYSDEVKTIIKKQYSFSFPVIIPEIIPTTNIWTVSVCSTEDGGCMSPEDSSVLLNFPLAGFQIGDTHPHTKRTRVSAAGGIAVLAALISVL